MTIDWDRIADDADESPRALLARWLNEVDDVTTLVILAERRSTDPLDKEGTTFVSYESSGNGMTVLGLMQYAFDAHRDLYRTNP